jgi:hypothetical protein
VFHWSFMFPNSRERERERERQSHLLLRGLFSTAEKPICLHRVAFFGFISASISMYKTWKPSTLQVNVESHNCKCRVHTHSSSSSSSRSIYISSTLSLAACPAYLPTCIDFFFFFPPRHAESYTTFVVALQGYRGSSYTFMAQNSPYQSNLPKHKGKIDFVESFLAV